MSGCQIVALLFSALGLIVRTAPAQEKQDVPESNLVIKSAKAVASFDNLGIWRGSKHYYVLSSRQREFSLTNAPCTFFP